jgi:serine/threonine protein kinase
MSAPPSVTAGRYQLLTRLGQGSTGVVYTATDPDRQRQVAVKVMLPDVAQDAASRQHFLREARAISRLRHRHLAAVYETGVNDETPWFAMELLRGTTLAARVTVSPPLTLVESLDIVDQLCVGLQFAHEHGLVHRNVTPANIWLLDDGSVKLVDFGLPPTSVPTVVDARALVGRVAYMSPEQISAHAVDGRADIFSAGVVLFELVTGRRPFEAESITGIFDKVVNEAAPSVIDLLPPGAAPLQAALQRALDKDPARRYGEPLEMAADLTLVRLALLEAQASPPQVEPAVPASVEPVREMAVSPASPAAPVAPAVAAAPALAAQPLAGEAAPVTSREDDHDWLRDPQSLIDETSFDGDEEPPRGIVGWARLQAEILGSSVRENPLVAAAGGVAVLLAIVIGAWLAWRTPLPPLTGLRTNTTRETTTPPVSATEVRIESDPADAELYLNGAALGLRTPTTLPIDRLRGAEVRAAKAGFEPVTVRVAAADIEQRRLVLRLTPEAPPIAVSGSAPFAFEVLSGRTVVSRAATSHRFTIRGDQTLRVRAPEYFLDRAVPIVPGRSAITLYVPPLGRLSVRTTPSLERCKVSIAGRDFGTPPYPPIQYQPIVAGTHRVQLTCPDGSIKQEPVTVEAARDRSITFR